jgi:hypothetical protein
MGRQLEQKGFQSSQMVVNNSVGNADIRINNHSRKLIAGQQPVHTRPVTATGLFLSQAAESRLIHCSLHKSMTFLAINVKTLFPEQVTMNVNQRGRPQAIIESTGLCRTQA